MAQAENAKKLDYTPVTYDDQYILMVNQLKKYFPIKGGLMSQTVGHVKAVDGVTFNLKRGHTMGLVGESGCGKSTTGRSILRLIEPTSGEIVFQGKDITKLSKGQMRHVRKDMQIIFQDPYSSLNPRMTVGNIIGANIMDLTLIMPLCALILGKPLPVERQGMLLDIPACLIVTSAALVPALISGRFKRWTGFLIGGLYIAYLAVMFTCFGV